MAKPRTLTPLQVPCEACGAMPYLACWPGRYGFQPTPHPQRVALANARNRMAKRERSLWGRLKLALTRG